jgi:hypothetical protein
VDENYGKTKKDLYSLEKMRDKAEKEKAANAPVACFVESTSEAEESGGVTVDTEES